MRKTLLYSLTFFALLLSSCSTSTPLPTPEVVSVYSSSFTQPWLTVLYDCAAQQNGIVLSRVDDPNAADIAVKIGEPAFLSSYAYQIDEEEILIVTNRVSPLQDLTLEQAQALFLGLGNPTVQIWLYAPDADVQRVFEQLVMEGRSIPPSINIASTPQQMSDILVNQENTVGILPRHWNPSTGSGQGVGDARIVFSAGTVPVLALTKSEPQDVIKQLIACLQSK